MDAGDIRRSKMFDVRCKIFFVFAFAQVETSQRWMRWLQALPVNLFIRRSMQTLHPLDVVST